MSPPSRPGGVYASITRDQDSIKASIGDGDLPLAQASMSVDCGKALIYEGYPEIRLGQRHPLRPASLSRLLVVRYSLEVFKIRARENEPFRRGLEDWFTDPPQDRGEPGYFSHAMDAAAESDPNAVTIDTDSEWMSRTGHRGTMTFISTTAWELFKASQGRSDSLYLWGPVEVTMPIRVLADILLSWKNVADAMPSDEVR